MKETILEVTDLSVGFSMYDHGLQRRELEVVHRLSLTVRAGEILAVVGSSGSGKSLLAHAVLGLLPRNARRSGEIRYRGEILDAKRRRDCLGTEIAYIPQGVDYLDPTMRVGKQVVGLHGTRERQEELFRRYQLPEDTARKYPFQLSGGMARRVLIAAAVMGSPRLIVADEPTPGLSVDLAMETLRHFRTLADEGAAVLLITHDVDLALRAADRMAVFYAGTVLETAPVADFLSGGEALRHPYSRALMAALPQNEFRPLPGTQPYAGHLPSGCLFASRCPLRDEACAGEIPLRMVRGGEVRCVHALEGRTH